MQAANSYFDRPAVFQLEDFPSVFLLQENRIGRFHRVPDSGYLIEDRLEVVDHIPNRVENFDDQNDCVDQRNGKPDAARSFDDFRGATQFDLRGKVLDYVEDGAPRIEQTLHEVFRLLYGSLNVDDPRLKPKVFAKIFPSLHLGLEAVKQVYPGLKGAREMIDDLLPQVEERPELRELVQNPLENLIEVEVREKVIEEAHSA